MFLEEQEGAGAEAVRRMLSKLRRSGGAEVAVSAAGGSGGSGGDMLDLLSGVGDADAEGRAAVLQQVRSLQKTQLYEWGMRRFIGGLSKVRAV
jgi:hypothetical protein